MGNDLSDWKSHVDQLDRIRALSINYDPQSFESSTDKLGWAVDHHRGHLAFEKKGPAEAGGPFERASAILKNYQFPNPHIVVGYFDPDAPLLGRNMLLKAKFLGFTFYFATRVNNVIDDEEKNELGNSARVWGYSYQTLQGHFEEGQMRFTIWKDYETGEVSFHIDAYSKVATIHNPFYRLGFHIFKRPLQKEYARTAIERMQGFLNAN